MRTGAIAEPTVGQVSALAAVFGVEPSYLMDREVRPRWTRNCLRTFSTIPRVKITRQALRLQERERQIVPGIVRQFGEGRQAPGGG